jgi:lipopolysaccharide transport system permease protein
MSADPARTRTVVAGRETVRWTAPLAMLRAVWAARTVVRALVVRDVRGRYVGSAFGALWSVAHPLLQLATYTFVFATVLKVKVTDIAGGDVPFVLYLACGLFPWLAIQEAITRSATCLVDNPTLVKRVVFPVEVLPVQLACVAVVHQLIATALLGLGWALATLHVYFRDTAQALAVLLPVWFYLTPILYPPHLVPSFLQPVLALNPLTPLVQAWRDVLLHGVLPSAGGALWLGIASVVVFVGGALLFSRARGEFADLV